MSFFHFVKDHCSKVFFTFEQTMISFCKWYHCLFKGVLHILPEILSETECNCGSRKYFLQKKKRVMDNCIFFMLKQQKITKHYSFHSFDCFCLSQQCNGSNVVEGMKAPAPLFAATQYKTMTPWHIHHVVKIFLNLYCCTSLLTSSIHKPLFPLVLTSDWLTTDRLRLTGFTLKSSTT